ncbi:MAG: hemerythrin domain-containing protein [Gallionella sp.]
MIFSKVLSLGNRAIDSEHKKIHDLINKIADLRGADTLLKAFELLENNLAAYFVVEENIARAIEFDFAQHRLAHQCLLNDVHFIKNEMMAKNGLLSKTEEKGYIDSLWHCLIRHIKEDGKPFKAVLDTHFYDFNPGRAG